MKADPFEKPIQFPHRGSTYRTNRDASVVERYDDKKKLWSRTRSAAVRKSALAAIDLRDVGHRVGTWTGEPGGYRPPWLVEEAHHATRKSPTQLQREIDEVLGRSAHSTVTGSWEPREGEITSTAGLMAIAATVARDLKRSGMTWGDTSRGRGRDVRVWSSGTSVRFEIPSRYQGHPSEAQAIVDLHLVGPDRSRTTVGPFAGDAHYDKRFGEAMEQRVRQLLKKGVR